MTPRTRVLAGEPADASADEPAELFAGPGGCGGVGVVAAQGPDRLRTVQAGHVPGAWRELERAAEEE
ncbi:hypothetical protein MMF93_02370 [Streptomyces tubbatahanensis]|uniref:Uncharacterized protein n=1 Tax=Streptomyces tubbatahanensis TaxID=2923272 RepID=A0ABY3XLY8_9ACTN|nr:hypothetical protein [Streptomyces tubbatahanensis]UNS95441.1 hypothetical protein MMF93_02370 [Streptomyces tubbatahanensis]